MPDFDDLFEDAFDIVKKQVRTHRKKRKKRKKRRADGDSRDRSLRGDQSAPSEQTRADAHYAGSLPVGNVPDANGATPAGWRPLQRVRQRLHGPQIHSARLRMQLEQSEAYAAGIKKLAGKARSDVSRARLDDLVRHTEHWRKSLEALVARVDAYQQNGLLQRDLETVPLAIERLEKQLQETDVPRLAGELQRALDNRRRQLASLEKLASTMQWAEIKIENTVSVLGALYSQAHVSQSKGQVADFRRLMADVEEEARSLDDYVSAMAEVKGL